MFGAAQGSFCGGCLIMSVGEFRSCLEMGRTEASTSSVSLSHPVLRTWVLGYSVSLKVRQQSAVWKQ